MPSHIGSGQLAHYFPGVDKETFPLKFALPLMCRNITANLIKSLCPEFRIGRRGRLKGNVLAYSHVLKGQLVPELFLKL